MTATSYTDNSVLQTSLGSPAQRVSRTSQKLAFFPLEVVIMIMMELDWVEVVRTRRTCRVIYVASQSRQLWLKIFEESSLQYDHPLPFAKYVGVLPTSELERRLTDWLRVEVGWLSKDRQPRRRRIGHFTEDSAHLVEGGQWLLTFNRYGRGPIYVYDLDSPMCPKIKLIEPTTPCTQLQMSIQVLDTFPRLEFILALLCDVTGYCPVRLEIWKVVASDTAYGHRLSSTLLTSFATPFHICGRRDLRDNLFACQVYRHGAPRISIVDWSRSSSLGLCEAAIYPDSGSTGIIKLLPGRRIVTIGQRGARIYQYSPCSYETLPEPIWGFLTPPIKALELPYTVLTHTVTPPYTDHAGTIHILFGTPDGLMQVSIPECLEDARVFFALSVPPYLPSFGRYRLLMRYASSLTEWCALTACLYSSERVRFNISPPDWPTLIPPSESFTPCYLDDESGRFAEVDERNRLFVVDHKIW